MNCFQTARPNSALNPVPFGRWTLRDETAQRQLALRYAFHSTYEHSN
jgi:hypothetical protein